ncbi:reverse transcriptase [Phytophthora megakarya]|uniref:Reverse transcriptase n=1 Tax=Phytophthora megakarya TaxID=4795 RepID=A0A225V1Q3_9STRA|nr:reverse transcriptase [Phytophthora megakarya]
MSNFAATMWFMTLNMASGFWAVPMTARAQLISAFICPLGHFHSYIDDIIYGAPSWDDLCKTLNALLYRLRYWNISKCKYLGHDISSDGIRTSPKRAEKVLNLPFPKTQ